MDKIDLRPLTPRDLTAVLEVERVSFVSPWDVNTFKSTLEDKRCLSLLARNGPEVVGYCIALDLTSMVHILNLAVHPHWRGRGLGRRLIEEMLVRSASSGKVCAVLEVRTSNLSARSLYSSLGFVHVNTWRGYYTDTNEDASIMIKDLRRRSVVDAECTVLHNAEAAQGIMHIVLEGNLPQADPGQFVMLQVGMGFEPFLRRPLAVLSQKEGRTELLYKVRGPGTELLSRKTPGQAVRLLGPLGRGFTRRKADLTVYAAGGMGLPPLLYLAERLEAGVFIAGAGTSSELAMIERIASIPGVDPVVMTEDGSAGARGRVTDALESVMGQAPAGCDITVYACGPEGMLREAARIAGRKGAFCEVSIEERMGCGFGVCAGCVVETNSGPQRVCREGPVFNTTELAWG
jgi:dihydroorotate dehydrogenase electron transfer subunit